jgi:hypothetical protein
VTALASEAGGPILGRMGEAVTCLSAGEKERGKKGAGRRPAPFCGGSVVRQRGKGGGVRGSTPCGVENGEERGGPGAAGDSSGVQHRPPAGGRGRRRCGATGEGSGRG